MILVQITCYKGIADRWQSYLGYFDDIPAAKRALAGLCPGDFNTMAGSGDYRDFIFQVHPGVLDSTDDAKFIAARELNLQDAAARARQCTPSWYRRAPETWGRDEEE